MADFDVTNQRDSHDRLPDGDESEWTIIARLPIMSGKIAVSDPMFYRDLPPPTTFEIANATYDVAIKLMNYPGDQRVSRLRVLLGQTADFGPRLEDVGVDFAQVGVFDPRVLEKASESLSEKQCEELIEQFNTMHLYSVAQFGSEPNAMMPFANSGFGDGRYPIHDLLRDGNRVGIEIVFIGPEVNAA